MSDSKKPTKAGAVELEESELDDVQGGASLDTTGNFNFKVEIEGVKPRLTDAEIRARKDSQIGIRARTIEGTKIRK